MKDSLPKRLPLTFTMPARAQIDSPYMKEARQWHSRYMLGSSGVAPMLMAELGEYPSGLELNPPPGPDAAKPLRQRIARYCGVDPDCVVPVNGCSMANHLAFAATFDPGDDVLVEQPTYELLLSALQFLGARIRRFARPEEAGYQFDLRQVEKQLTPSTRLIVLCNLHNPSSALLTNDELRPLGELARSTGARVLVDEVYLEAVRPRPATALTLGPEFLVTSSLTKAYGLGGLRCGWILAPPDLARQIICMSDLFGVYQPYASDQLAVLALDGIERVAARAQKLLAANRQRALEFLHSRDDLECCVPEHGTTLFPRLKRGDVDELAARLERDYDTMIVPGRFFEMPRHFRLGLGGSREMFDEGVSRLAKALDESL